MLTIRPATKNDATAIASCVEHAYSYYIPLIGKLPGPMLEDYVAVIAAHEVYVAQAADGEIAGALVLVAQADRLLLDNIAVLPAVQGQGVGRQLIALAERRAVEMDYQEIELYTHLCMVENQAIYTAMGYVECRRISEKGFDRIYFNKQLV